MRFIVRFFFAVLLPSVVIAEEKEKDFSSIFGHGINLGNALEAPEEGQWGVTLEEGYFDLIREAGFQHVRVPIRWSAHAAREIPYTINPEFFMRVDWVLDNATQRDLAVILNVHHYEELYSDPEGHHGRFLGLWRQIAPRYADRPQTVAFELLNEPHGSLTNEKWNPILAEALDVVRDSNPDRFVIVGGGNYNNWRELDSLVPPDDDHLVATFHYYEPYEFTHQGAEWGGPDLQKHLGRTWTGEEDQARDVREAFDRSVEWAEEKKIPLYLGEFGVYSKADMDSRVTWTRFVREEAEAREIPWAYWEFCSGFGIYHAGEKRWREGLKNALIPTAH